MTGFSTVTAWHEVVERVDAACNRSGRANSEVRLIAVSKFHPVSAMIPLIQAGQLDFGESRVQELAVKASETPGNVRWHFIGALQKNKINKVLPHLHMLHSLESIELAESLQQRIHNAVLPTLIQVNLGKEPQKSGIHPDLAPALLEYVLTHCGQLQIAGLMTIPPARGEPRQHFRSLRALRDRLSERTGVSLPELSMGMSQDFELAIEEGATIVRVGTTIFGPRDQCPNA